MIVTDDNFASIVAAVEEGRGIYDNIRKTLQYLLAVSGIQDSHRHAANQRVTSLHLVRGHRMKGQSVSTSNHHPFTS